VSGADLYDSIDYKNAAVDYGYDDGDAAAVAVGVT
jgi:hypothetical protein